ncbi:DUF1223 domain-containing protein [Lacinutrix mariniflava]|uniref:DUF1223 domain-containing protein n=1 Tax=Lacinutrix mariniflava TaxID=342955 RepID=UPI0009FAC7F5|nr:DUF1223 domain-containing protein [Lacinutrix mariniflava]
MQNTLLSLFMMLFFLQPSNIENEIENFNPVVVLELFTSQGCSSCPSADALLKKVSENDKNIIALSYHVDYWNYIGWKDPFAKAEFTKKQRAYSAKFYSNTIYTPQTVINGKEHFVGSKVSVMNEKLKQYKKIDSKNKIELLDLKKEANSISLNYKVRGDITNKSLRLVVAIKERITEVKRGENSNKTLTNTNVVVQEQLITLEKNNGSLKIEIPNVVLNKDELSIIGIIQNNELDILTGVKLEL